MHADEELPSVSILKSHARALKRESSLTHSEALDVIVARYGFVRWNQLMKHIRTSIPATPGKPAEIDSWS